MEFKTSDPHDAAGGFADVWKGTYEEKEVAFKSVRASALSDGATRSKRKVRETLHVTPSLGPSLTPNYYFRKGFSRKWCCGNR